MRYPSHRRPKRILFSLIAIALCITAVPVWRSIDKRLRPSAERMCEEQCHYLLSQAITEGVEETLRSLSKQQLTTSTAQRNASGVLVSVDANSYTMNLIQTMLLQNVNDALQAQKAAELQVPIGSLTGLYTMSGRGPCIPLRFYPLGSASVKLQSSLTSGGINQTLYRLTAVVSVRAACAVPLYQADVSAEFSYLFHESVIIGEVPFAQ